MDVTEAQKTELSRLFATHLQGFAMRRATAEDAGMADAQIAGEPLHSWRMLIDEAIERGRLRHLLAAAARQAPGDPVLEHIAEASERGVIDIPAEPVEGSLAGPLMGMLVALLALGGLVAIGWWLMQPPSAGSAEDSDTEVPHVEVREGIIGNAPAPRPVAPAPAPVEDTDDAGEEDTDLPPPPGSDKFIRIPDPNPPPEPVDAPAPAPAPAASGCVGPSGKVIGYAYAGSAEPAVTSGFWTAPQDVNVRAVYPTADNGFDTSGDIVCVLMSGSKVAAGAPIVVPGGSFWVPVMGAGG